MRRRAEPNASMAAEEQRPAKRARRTSATEEALRTNKGSDDAIHIVQELRRLTAAIDRLEEKHTKLTTLVEWLCARHVEIVDDFTVGKQLIP